MPNQIKPTRREQRWTWFLLFTVWIYGSTGCRAYQTLKNRACHPKICITQTGADRSTKEIHRLEKQLQKQPNSAELHYELADKHLNEGNLIPASRYIGNAIQLAPEFVPAWLLSAELNLQKQMPEEALSDYQHAMSIAKNLTQQKVIQQGIVDCYLELERPGRAADAIENLFVKYENNPPVDLLEAYAQIMMQMKQFDRANEAIALVCHHEDASEDDVVGLIESQVKWGQTTAATKSISAYLEEVPHSQKARTLQNRLAGANSPTTIYR